MEGVEHGIKTVLLEPGDTKTDFTSKRQKYIPETSMYKKEANKAISRMEKDEENGRSPETVAKAALKAASQKNPLIRKPIGCDLLSTLPHIAVSLRMELLLTQDA